METQKLKIIASLKFLRLLFTNFKNIIMKNYFLTLYKVFIIIFKIVLGLIVTLNLSVSKLFKGMTENLSFNLKKRTMRLN